MAEKEQVQVDIVGENKDLKRKLKEAQKQLKDTASRAEGANKKMQSAFRETAAAVAAFQGPLGPVAGRINALGAAIGRSGLAVTGLGAVLFGATLALKKAVTAASDFNREFNRLRGIVKATGAAAGFSASEINKFAQDLGESTLTSASAAREAAGVILTFKSITGDTFKQTLALAQDLSEAGFGSLRQTSLQLSKALEEPIQGLNALRRSGVSFTEAQKELIKGLVETGRKAEAQKMILSAVNDQVGGAGVAAAEGLAGAMDTLGERIDRVWILLGNSVPVKLAAKAINGLSEAIMHFLKPAEDAAMAQEQWDKLIEPNVRLLDKLGISLDGIESNNLEQVTDVLNKVKEAGVDLLANEPYTELQNRIFQAQHMVSVYEWKVKEAQKTGSFMGQTLIELNNTLGTHKRELADASEALAELAAKASIEEQEAARLKKIVDDEIYAKKALKDATDENIKASDAMSDAIDKIIEKSDPLATAIDTQATMVGFLQRQLNAGEISATHFYDAMVALGSVGPVAGVEGKDKSADEEKKRKEAAIAKLAAQSEEWLTEEEMLAVHMGKNMEIIQEGLDAGVISEEDAAQRRLKVLEDYHKAKDALDSKQFKQGLTYAAGFFSSMMAITSKSSKGLFEMAKIGAIATATIQTYQSVTNAMANVPFPYNFVAAAASLAAGLQQVMSIRSTSFGGGGGGGAAPAAPTAGGGGGGAAAPTSVSQPTTVQQTAGTRAQHVIIALGDEDDLVSKKTIRNIIDGINEQIADGAIVSIGVD